jgi:hypothetical protein
VNRIVLAIALSVLTGASGCVAPFGEKRDANTEPDACARPMSDPSAGSVGTGLIFDVDPRAASGDPILPATSTRLDSYRSQATLADLGGRGVLEGTYVDVRNGLGCAEGFDAFSAENQFNYSEKDARFQEVMAYVWGDRYRSGLENAGVLSPDHPVKIVAHCMRQDNAYYLRMRNDAGQLIEKVCLGDSVATPGASYGDDAVVVLHELQHATTVNTYSLTQELNEYWYDEAGALNEAISDFLALSFTEPYLPASFDPKVFSRWALGAFFPHEDNSRGAHRCPTYDSDYPRCANYAADASGYSAENNSLSYAYPDGLGWPYGNNFSAPGYLRSAFMSYSAQEEIHNAGILISGALWDVYDSLKVNHGGDSALAHQLSSQIVMEALRNLPKPTQADRSPVTFRGFAQEVVNAATNLGLSNGDQASIRQELAERGLVDGSTLPSDWAEVGTGTTANPGLKIIDDPGVLKTWLRDWLGIGPAAIPQGTATGFNSRLDSGEVVALWFDVRDIAALTAGGVSLDVVSPDPAVSFLNGNFNPGYIAPDHVQIRYFKINGTDIVSALSSANPNLNVPTGNSYFQTNPYYSSNPITAIWVKASLGQGESAPKSVALQVTLTPTNGPAQTLSFPVSVH